MDQIDINLLEAWHRIGEQCRTNRVKALRRCRRQFRQSLRRPQRAWCLVLRAADSRINSDNAFFEEECDGARQPHDLLLTGRLVRELTKPVFIDWPGVPTWEASRIIGITDQMAWTWGRKGYLHIERYDYCRMHGLKCGSIPIVRTLSPIDPNHPAGRPPEAVWGTLWLSRHEKFPLEFQQTVRRVPEYGSWKGKPFFWGWRWECPGVLGANGEIFGCGRKCRYLYGPLPVWTLPQACSAELTLDLPEDCGLAGQWRPGMYGVEPGAGRRTFACKHCWRVRDMAMCNSDGWNDFVTHISGGLLYGRDVPRPPLEAPLTRIRRKTTRRKRFTTEAMEVTGNAIHTAAQTSPRVA